MRQQKLVFLAAALALTAASAAALRVERGALTFDGIPSANAPIDAVLDGYLSARQASVLGFSPSGALLVATRFGETDQLHLVDRPGGDRQQISFYREPIAAAVFAPRERGNTYAFLKDTDGDENAQIYLRNLAPGGAKLLTDGKSRNGGLVWSTSGRQLAFFSTQRDGASSDIYSVDSDAGVLPKLILAGDRTEWYAIDFSPDDGRLLVLNRVSSESAHLYVVDIASGQKHEIDAAKDIAAVRNARFAHDGLGIYMITNRDDEFGRLYYVNLASGEKTPLTAHIPWDIEELELSRDGRYLAYLANQNGASRLNVIDLLAKQELTVPSIGMGVVQDLHFDFASRRLAFDFASANAPRDAYVFDLASQRVEQWTHSEAGPVNLQLFATPRLVQVPTFDRSGGRQRPMPVYLYSPAGTGPHPVLLVLHGGPESQFRPGFDAWLAYVVNELGYSVVAPNVRGSSGYGKTYMSLDNGMLREDAVKDVGALLVWIGAQHEFDAKRVVVSGGSYGGYLALASLVNYSDRLRGAVDFVGISSFPSFLQNTAPYRRELRRAEYGDERDPEMHVFLQHISPLANVERMQRPLLVVAGKNDPRVPVSESEQIVNRIRAKNGEVWYLLAGDEGHSFRKKSNRDAYLQTFAAFLAHLK
jgi:dipeptidyl aminopeptidase/acylaminoacyl peptidase